MTNIAIIGHKTRGKEVIEIFEMLGGNNPHGYVADNDCFYFYISDETRNICYDWFYNFDDKDVTIFTLEEFLEKFPYKVGDRVRVPEYESEVCISKMYWDGNEVQYEVVTDEVEWYSAKELNEFNEPNEPNKENNMNKRSKGFESLNVETYLKVWDETENGLEVCVAEGYEMIEKNGQFYIVKQKTKYPRDYEECCNVLGIDLIDAAFMSGNLYKVNRIQRFQKLLVCRDAYWKMAGEQMGLGKPWEPNWENGYENHYTIVVCKHFLKTGFNEYSNRILMFPTAEMRDAFYENFKDLIIECKELL